MIYNHKKIIFKKVYIFNKRVYDYVLLIDEIIIKKKSFFLLIKFNIKLISRKNRRFQMKSF